jgi:uncharacterized protein (DUF736 family)
MSDNKTETSKWDQREVGALWTKISKDKTQKYMTGHINTSLEGKIDIVIFSNKEKKSDKSPDFRIYISDTTQKPKGDIQKKPAQVPDEEHIL